MADLRPNKNLTQDELEDLIKTSCTPEELLESMGFEDIEEMVDTMVDVISERRMSIIDNLTINGVLDEEE